LLAEAVIGCPVAGVGLLWWISVAPAARRRGLGLGLLGSALDLLVGLGAREVILVVEDTCRPTTRSSTEARRTACTTARGCARSTACGPSPGRGVRPT
jgi:GNAT superfamily N-acetyltransferase